MSKVKNYRVEMICSLETKQKFEDMLADLSLGLHKKLRRRVVAEDYLVLFLDIYKNYPWVFEEHLFGKPRIK